MNAISKDKKKALLCTVLYFTALFAVAILSSCATTPPALKSGRPGYVSRLNAATFQEDLQHKDRSNFRFKKRPVSLASLINW